MVHSKLAILQAHEQQVGLRLPPATEEKEEEGEEGEEGEVETLITESRLSDGRGICLFKTFSPMYLKGVSILAPVIHDVVNLQVQQLINSQI